jgi:hypothetical protein
LTRVVARGSGITRRNSDALVIFAMKYQLRSGQPDQ